jgi:Fe-Mn family superoxide dismutase
LGDVAYGHPRAMPVYTLPDLPYDYSALEPAMAARVVELHHDKHHATYVKGANEALERLDQARREDEFGAVNMLQKNLAFHLSGHVLHSIFWTNLAPDGGGKPEGDLADAIDDGFGGFDRFRDQLTAASTSVQGSGWGALVWEPVGRRLYVEQVYDHESNVGQGTTPLLVFDAWEHAYYLQYENEKGAFFEALWSIVNWTDVAARFDAASQST